MPNQKQTACTFLEHPFDPLYDENSHILILGSFPSVKSREQAFFYGHPQNRFWRLLALLFREPVPQTIPEKRALCHTHHIALWDVIASCEIVGSSDSSIKNAKANDISTILSVAPIERIFVNGKTASKLYDRYILPQIGRPAVCLPSTSPANAAWNMERLYEAWKAITENCI